MTIKFSLLFSILFIVTSHCYTQEVIDLGTIILYTESELDSIQTLVTVDTISTDKLKDEKVKNDSIVGFFSIFKGKPGRAAFYSLIIPGGGQVYNKRALKAGLAIGADAFAVGNAINQTRKFNEDDRLYRGLLKAREAGLFSFEGIPISNIESSRRIREQQRQYKDYAWFSVGIVHLITVIEAFVDRHLLGFDIDDDLTINFAPNIGIPNSQGIVGLQYNF